MDMLLSFFISSAWAVDGVPQGSGMAQILLLVAFILIFYFLLWRPQSKRAKEHRALVSGLKAGDEVITGGGMMGRITGVENDFIRLSIAKDVEIKVQRHAVSVVLPKAGEQSASATSEASKK